MGEKLSKASLAFHFELRESSRGLSLSVFWVSAVLALLITAGLVVDGSAHAAAQRQAQLVAAQAARAGQNYAVANELYGDGMSTLALVEADRVIAAHPDIAGRAQITPQGELQVDTETKVDTVFLSLIGVNSLTARGSAAADLFVTP